MTLKVREQSGTQLEGGYVAVWSVCFLVISISTLLSGKARLYISQMKYFCIDYIYLNSVFQTE